MGIRTVEGVFEFLAGQLEEAEKHDTEFDRGRASATRAALSLLTRVDSCDIEKLHEAVSKWTAIFLLVPDIFLFLML